MNRPLRHAKILGLIQSAPVLSQAELSQKLKSNGIRVTQATLSRDLRDLHILKTPAGYRSADQLQAGPINPELQSQTIVQFMTQAQSAGNLVVVKTQPGNASPVARSLDAIGWNEIVGTVAGDDTILIVTSSLSTARQVEKRLLALGR